MHRHTIKTVASKSQMSIHKESNIRLQTMRWAQDWCDAAKLGKISSTAANIAKSLPIFFFGVENVSRSVSFH